MTNFTDPMTRSLPVAGLFTPRGVKLIRASNGGVPMSSYGEYYKDGRSIDPDKHTQDPAEPDDVKNVPVMDVRETEGN